MLKIFDCDIKTMGQLEGIRSLNQIKDEPMIFSGDYDFTMSHGGPLTHAFLESIRPHIDLSQIKQDGLYFVFDSRVTMTMKGAYPSIPGWHCDDVPRSASYEQPDLNKIDKKIKHFMILFATVESQTCTEFVTDRNYQVEIDTSRVWNSLNEQTERLKPKTRFVKAGEVVRFCQNSVHRASPTVNPGWRVFMRASVTHRKPANEIRKQVQVYIPMENPGW